MTTRAANNRPPETGGLSLGEVYYVLFRRKWLILLFSAAGVAAALGVYFLTPRMYQSEARLYVKYVVENRLPDVASTGDQVRTVDSTGLAIMNSEAEILTSLDLLKQVAETITPEKILPKGTLNPDVATAATYLSHSVVAGSERDSSVIGVALQHPDPEIAQKVLQLLVVNYRKKHDEIHLAAGLVGNYLTQQRDKSRAELTRIDEELRTLKSKAGVVSVEDSRRMLLEQAARIRQELLECEAELAERKALLKDQQVAAGHSPVTNEAPVRAVIPAEKIDEYRRVMAQIESLRRREQDLLTQWTEGSYLVKRVSQLILEQEKNKNRLEGETPALKQLNMQAVSSSEKVGDITGDAARIAALLAKINVRTNQLELIQSNLVAIELIEPRINQLEAERTQTEASLRAAQTSLDRSMMSSTAGAGGVPNIAVVQEASPARPVVSKRLKMMAIALAGGVGGGIGLAFLIELVLRQSIRHASQVEKKLGLPLFISIPRLFWNGAFRSRKPQRTGRSRRAGSPAEATAGEAAAASGTVAASRGSMEIAEWCESHPMRAYHEALRDRLMTFFEVRNMTHKPKLVAVTSCSDGAGVSSVAAGLAATLSETGDGNVLLVDMNLEHGATHPFFRGRPAIGLAEAFNAEDRQPAHVQDNLYAVAAGVTSGSMARALPKRLANLIPQFKASDYDYIIFDMPPVTQTSLTPRLSSYMDMVLLVLEAEKTNLGVAGKAAELLRESRANVGAVLNRKPKYVPASLFDEF